MKTRDQQYASSAYQHVLAVDQKDQGKSKEQRTFANSYGAMAHKLPILIHTSGLAQALHFVKARGEDGPKCLLNDLSKTVLGPEADKECLLKRAREDDLRAYIHLTRQVLAALLWYKRYAQAILDIEAGEGEKSLVGGGEQ